MATTCSTGFNERERERRSPALVWYPIKDVCTPNVAFGLRSSAGPVSAIRGCTFFKEKTFRWNGFALCVGYAGTAKAFKSEADSNAALFLMNAFLAKSINFWSFTGLRSFEVLAGKRESLKINFYNTCTFLE